MERRGGGSVGAAVRWFLLGGRAALVAAGVALLLAVSVSAQNPLTADFPGAVVTDAEMLVWANSATTTLTASIDASTLTIPVASGATFRAPTSVKIGTEHIKICSVAPTALTACAGGRGYDSTTAATHAGGGKVENIVPAYWFNKTAIELIGIQQALGASLANVAAATHAARHAQGGADALTVENLASGCGNGATLEGDGAGGVVCGVDDGGGGGGSVAVEEGDATVTAAASAIDFNATDFDVTEAPAGEANVAISAALVRDADTPAAGDVTGSFQAGLAVADDSHAHTGATISGVDVSDDTNLSADGQGLELTGDALSLELDGATLTKSASGVRVSATYNAPTADALSANPAALTNTFCLDRAADGSCAAEGDLDDLGGTVGPPQVELDGAYNWTGPHKIESASSTLLTLKAGASQSGGLFQGRDAANGLKVEIDEFWNFFSTSGFLRGTQAYYSTNLDVRDGWSLCWSSTTVYSGPKDLCAQRSAAGVLKVSDGSTGYSTLDAGAFRVSGAALNFSHLAGTAAAGQLPDAEGLNSSCAAGETLEGDGAGGVVCGTDDTAGGGGTIVVQEDDATVAATASTVDFLGADFDVTESPAGEANVVVAAAIARDAESPAAGDVTGSLSAGYQVTDDSHAHTGSTISALDAADVTTGAFADARISESSVTQHEAALTITESQISDLAHTVDTTKALQDEGLALTQRATLNFTGAGVSCADNAGSSRTDCTIAGGGSSINAEEGNVEVIAAANLTGFDFAAADFDLTDDANEADVAIAAAIARDAESPAAGDVTGSLSAGYQVTDDSHAHTGATISALAAADIESGQLALARGGTGADLSATGGAGQVLQQSSVGDAVSVGALGIGSTTGDLAASRVDDGGAAATQALFSGAAGAAAFRAIADGDLPAGLTRDSESPAAGDVTGSYAAGLAVTDDSHAHTGATISGVDVSDDTNLSADGQGLELTGDALALELDGATLTKSASGVRVSATYNAPTASALAANPAALTNTFCLDRAADGSCATQGDLDDLGGTVDATQVDLTDDYAWTGTHTFGTGPGSLELGEGTALGAGSSAGLHRLYVDATTARFATHEFGGSAVFYTATIDLDSSAELAALVGDETGSGALAFATSPTLTTPTLSGGVTGAGTHYYDFPEITATNPAANFARLYGKDNGAGVTQLCYRDSAGTETCIGAGGSETGLYDPSVNIDTATYKDEFPCHNAGASGVWGELGWEQINTPGGNAGCGYNSRGSENLFPSTANTVAGIALGRDGGTTGGVMDDLTTPEWESVWIFKLEDSSEVILKIGMGNDAASESLDHTNTSQNFFGLMYKSETTDTASECYGTTGTSANFQALSRKTTSSAGLQDLGLALNTSTWYRARLRKTASGVQVCVVADASNPTYTACYEETTSANIPSTSTSPFVSIMSCDGSSTAATPVRLDYFHLKHDRY